MPGQLFSGNDFRKNFMISHDESDLQFTAQEWWKLESNLGYSIHSPALYRFFFVLIYLFLFVFEIINTSNFVKFQKEDHLTFLCSAINIISGAEKYYCIEMGSSSSKFRKHLQNGDEVAALNVYNNHSDLRKGLDPNCSYGDNFQHETPLHFAARHGMKSLLRFAFLLLLVLDVLFKRCIWVREHNVTVLPTLLLAYFSVVLEKI